MINNPGGAIRLWKYTFVYGLLSCIFLIANSCSDTGTDKHLGQNNAVWAESIYLRGFNPTTGKKLSDQLIIEYANLLKKNGIKYVYLFEGPFDNLGNLPEFAFSDAAIRTVKILSSHHKNLVILPWVGGFQNKTVHLESMSWGKMHFGTANC